MANTRQPFNPNATFNWNTEAGALMNYLNSHQ